VKKVKVSLANVKGSAVKIRRRRAAVTGDESHKKPLHLREGVTSRKSRKPEDLH